MKSGLIGALVLSLVVEEHKSENEERRDLLPMGETHAQPWDNPMKNYLVRHNPAVSILTGEWHHAHLPWPSGSKVVNQIHLNLSVTINKDWWFQSPLDHHISSIYFYQYFIFSSN